MFDKDGLMDCAAIIPACGGSKGVPRKNLLILGEFTLLGWAIRQCELAGIEVFVSTDDDEIAAEAIGCGAAVIRRPAELATDTATSDAVLLHAVHHYVRHKMIALVQCTAPGMRFGEIRGAVETLWTHKSSDVCVAVTPDDGMQVQMGPDGHLVGHGWDISHVKTRRQDRRATYTILGSVWTMWRDSFIRRGQVYSEKTVPLIVDRPRLEIDTTSDVVTARRLYSHPYVDTFVGDSVV